MGGSSISDLLSPVEAAAERIERELSKDLLATADIFCDTGTLTTTGIYSFTPFILSTEIALVLAVRSFM